jgi:hypothetical protein
VLRINESGDREQEIDVSRSYITIFTEPKGEKELTPVKNSRESCRKRVLTTKCGEKKIIYIEREGDRETGREALFLFFFL